LSVRPTVKNEFWYNFGDTKSNGESVSDLIPRWHSYCFVFTILDLYCLQRTNMGALKMQDRKMQDWKMSKLKMA